MEGGAAAALLRQRGAVPLLAALAGIVAIALLAPAIATHDPAALDMARRYDPPSRDPSAPTRSAATSSRAPSTAPGSRSGGRPVARDRDRPRRAARPARGYYGGWIDALVSRLVDSTLAFPSLLLAIGVAFFAGPGIIGLVVALAAASWAPVARLVRATALRLRERRGSRRRGR
jgi:peptide/nickel transport system permease protein